MAKTTPRYVAIITPRKVQKFDQNYLKERRISYLKLNIVKITPPYSETVRKSSTAKPILGNHTLVDAKIYNFTTFISLEKL